MEEPAIRKGGGLEDFMSRGGKESYGHVRGI
jgi:hypothetical protein